MPDLLLESASFQDAVVAWCASGACSPALGAELLRRLNRLLDAVSAELRQDARLRGRAIDLADRAATAAEATQKELAFADLKFNVLRVVHEGIPAPSAVAAAMVSVN